MEIIEKETRNERARCVHINALVSCTDTPKQAHKRLASLLFEKGERFRKRHGNWIRLRLKGDYFLQMDSWNEAVRIKKGSGEPNHPNTSDVGAFKGKSLHYFGMDFGGHEVPKSQHMGRFWIYTALYS